MTRSPLQIISTDNKPSGQLGPKSSKQELEARFERLWMLDPDQFNPNRNCMERQRIERTWTLMCENLDFKQKMASDIGCGFGLLTGRMRDAGAHVDAVDISENALKNFKDRERIRIRTLRETMPFTKLPDSEYEVVVCTELLAELPAEQHRLFFSELNRLLKPEGTVVFSTGIDIDSEGVLEQLISLIQTEFEIDHAVYSHHSLFIRVRRYFNKFRLRFLDEKFKQSRPLLLWLETVSRFFHPQNPSHVIFLLKRKPLPNLEPEIVPIERPKKKEIWE